MVTKDKYDALIITAGAGMGVDSGLPDFRGTEGFWKAYPVIKDLGYSFSEMANPIWFVDNPELAWAFYGHRLNLYRETIPHQGFQLLLEYGESLSDGYGVITSNVDGHFHKAEFSDNQISEIHGSINHFQCSTSHCQDIIYDAPEDVIEIDTSSFTSKSIPKCPLCGSVARPNIMMFGDWGWNPTRTRDQETSMNEWIAHLLRDQKRVIIIEIGAGTAIPSIRRNTELLSEKFNATYYRINPRESEVNGNGIAVSMKGLEGIKHVLKVIKA